MKAAEYRNMSAEDLVNSLREVQKSFFDLRFQSATDRLETPSEMRKARREIARIKTVIRERELKGQAAPAPAQ
jgi:large subunit ribosomal protein L29